ncbi:MAG: hypothetical protein WD009_06520 [Phycisphaeraceae bacterium]
MQKFRALRRMERARAIDVRRDDGVAMRGRRGGVLTRARAADAACVACRSRSTMTSVTLVCACGAALPR